MQDRKKLGEILVDLRILTPAEVERVLHALRLRETDFLNGLRKDYATAGDGRRAKLLRRALHESPLYQVAEETMERLLPAAP